MVSFPRDRFGNCVNKRALKPMRRSELPSTAATPKAWLKRDSIWCGMIARQPLDFAPVTGFRRGGDGTAISNPR